MKRHPILAYTLLRLLLLVVVGAVLFGLGMRGALLLLVALVVSALASIPLLSSRRDAYSAAVAAKVESRKRAAADATAAEDAAADQWHREQDEADGAIGERRNEGA